MTMILTFLATGLVLGILFMILIERMRRNHIIRRAGIEATQTIDDAKEEAQHRLEEAQLIATEAEDEIWAKSEKEMTALQDGVSIKEDDYRKRRSQADRDYNQDMREIQKELSVVSDRAEVMQKREARLSASKRKNEELRKSLVSALQLKSGEDPENLKVQLYGQVENLIHLEARKKAGAYEDEIRASSEEMAKKILTNALNRFPRAACTERGVGVVEIPNDEVKKRMLGADGQNIAVLQELCGAEITISDSNTFSIVSFDPIVRETGTRCLEKLLHERAPNQDVVRRLFEKTRQDVARKVESDGNRIAAELGQRDLSPEVKKMLGTLRYRYSFAQNQHFHVSEVGWLCGILASELGSVLPGDAKRAGLLHDVGKAMDHNTDGGHAVIGADFIHQNGEKPHIVHAVRAHHYEEQPSSDLAFLVIAADAISGARPGARRSTVTVYNQKIEALSSIGDGFRGVTKTLVFNAGREVRIVVDSRRVNDEQSLRLCRQIADKIEKECTYPGQIKVVVVRETHSEAMAK